MRLERRRPARADHAARPAAGLLIANLAFYAWTRGWLDGCRRRRAATASRSGSPTRSARPASSCAGPRRGPGTSGICLEAGPFAAAEAAARRRAERALAPGQLGRLAQQTRHESVMIHVYRVGNADRRRRHGWPGCGSTAPAAASVPASAPSRPADRAGGAPPPARPAAASASTALGSSVSQPTPRAPPPPPPPRRSGQRRRRRGRRGDDDAVLAVETAVLSVMVRLIVKGRRRSARPSTVSASLAPVIVAPMVPPRRRPQVGGALAGTDHRGRGERHRLAGGGRRGRRRARACTPMAAATAARRRACRRRRSRWCSSTELVDGRRGAGCGVPALPPVVGKARAVACSIERTSRRSSDGLTESISAAVPATSGAEKLVPSGAVEAVGVGRAAARRPARRLVRRRQERVQAGCAPKLTQLPPGR